MGKYVVVTDAQSAIVQLSAAIISVVTCLMVVVSIQLDSRNNRKSYHLRLVQRLLTADIGLSLCVIFYFIMQEVLELYQLKYLCKLYLPLADYFFLVSYGWTVMLAFRFRDSFQEKKITGIPKTLWKVWAIPAVFAGVLLITDFASEDVVVVESSEAHTDRSCTFNHNTSIGIAMDILTFQGPLLVTIIMNCVTYVRGLRALRNTPHSVVARQMRKAGGYLGVLLVVWVPNIIYNFMSMFAGDDDTKYNGFLDLVIFLTSFQGFLNVCVYVWSDPHMKQWFCKHLVFVLPFRPAEPDESEDNRYHHEEENSPIRIDPNESEWLGGHDDHHSMHEGLLDAAQDSTHIHDEDEEGGGGESNQSRRLLAAGAGVDGRYIRRERDSIGSINSSINSGHKTKSILIAASNAKSVETKKRNSTYLASSADLDHERFVRFGENQVKVMASSLASSAPSQKSFDGSTDDNSGENEALSSDKAGSL